MKPPFYKPWKAEMHGEISGITVDYITKGFVTPFMRSNS